MMYCSSLRLLSLTCALVLTGACADEASGSGFSISGATNVTGASNPSGATASAGATDGPSTGELSSTGLPPLTTGDEPVTTTGVEPGTTGVEPMTTTTTGLEPSTGSDDTTGVMTTMTTMTTMVDETTGDPPPPPPPPPEKDPQPVAGMYEACVIPDTCDPPVNICFTVEVNNMKDGYCTVLCNSAADCGAKPKSPAVLECLTVNEANQKVCALKCPNGVADCPTGMACVNIGLPNNQSGMYCF